MEKNKFVYKIKNQIFGNFIQKINKKNYFKLIISTEIITRVYIYNEDLYISIYININLNISSNY